jgi:hypothetical protein
MTERSAVSFQNMAFNDLFTEMKIGLDADRQHRSTKLSSMRRPKTNTSKPITNAWKKMQPEYLLIKASRRTKSKHLLSTVFVFGLLIEESLVDAVLSIGVQANFHLCKEIIDLAEIDWSFRSKQYYCKKYCAS